MAISHNQISADFELGSTWVPVIVQICGVREEVASSKWQPEWEAEQEAFDLQIQSELGGATQIMYEKFENLVESLHSSFERLLAMEPVTRLTLPRTEEMPISGIYLFSESEDHLYVGRSNGLRQRIQMHGRPSSPHNQASFAFYIARHESGNVRASYKTDGARAALAADPDFGPLFVAAKTRIRNMDVRFVEEADQLRQALLEIYVHVALGTPYNDFKTH